MVCFTISAEFEAHPHHRASQFLQHRLQALSGGVGLAADDDAIGFDEGRNRLSEPQILRRVGEVQPAARSLARKGIAQSPGRANRQLRGDEHHGPDGQQRQQLGRP